MEVKTENPVAYVANSKPAEDALIEQAMGILKKRMVKHDVAFFSPDDAAQYLILKLAQQQHETFGVLMLNTQNQLIEDFAHFNGDVCHCATSPREIVRRALMVNATAMVLYHNHPSGNLTPSNPDLLLTDTIKQAASLFDIDVLDHILVAHEQYYSFATHGDMDRSDANKLVNLLQNVLGK